MISSEQKSQFQREVSQDLHWVIGSPGLLKPEAFPEPSLFLTDEFFQESLKALSPRLQSEHLLPILEQLGLTEEHKLAHVRAGRFFEQLAAKWIEQAYSPSDFLQNIPLKDSEGRVVGEFDFLFESERFKLPQHWETTVKFYLFADLPSLDPKESSSYFGTRLRDRLDKKIDRMLSHQLLLSKRPEAEMLFAHHGWESVESKAWAKGRLFYPLLKDWKNCEGPKCASQSHLRGWWVVAPLWKSELFSPNSRWEILERRKWLAERKWPMQNEPTLLSHAELEARLNGYFDSLPAESALHVAELQEGPEGWTEVSRGFVTHPEWQNRVADLLENPVSPKPRDLIIGDASNKPDSNGR